MTAARVGSHPAMTRFVLELSQAPVFEIFTLQDPYRVVIDLPEMDWRIPPEEVPRGQGVIEDLRFGLFQPGRSRVVLDVKTPVKVGKVQTLRPDGKVATHRLVIDLQTVSRSAFHTKNNRKIVSRTPLPAIQAAAVPTAPGKPPSDRRPTVVIDAGHGGVDPGARGVSGAVEKNLVLQYARELRRQLLASGRYRVVMTRDSDVVLPLRRRVARGEQAGGDLFISLHANIFKSRGVRGASVYTLSEKASDAEAEELAAKENKADVLSGVNLDGQSQDVSMILIDLAQRETMNLSKDFANTLVDALGKSTRLLPKPHRSAGFAVLKSPTVPSVLVEVGYMSNRSEEKLLRSRAHRKKISSAIIKAIDNYFKSHG
ncbi:MAG: N-acetylmuramoyl-L-alanine amidase [Rhodospirillales bacterium]|nr:N-acetylmuramoyl-L-alanine amidase [Rhodospirillales bacterium]MDH3792349.1 N-acetylmuramoyl-L-alanine amidase [Rhodospirillales bacterium]MDH3917293.1 N-acetylmuramoyl-L-alanine amidase [Rhodospirillales bacterium]MDH3966340.1 N-acetylmuramoyl-L-alanine amidase [Rhodospirillales bacterium]